MSALAHGNNRRRLSAGLAVGTVVSVLVLAGALASPTDVAGFEIDANLVNGTSSSATDWAPGAGGAGVISQTRNANGTCTAPSGPAVLICDPVKTDPTTFPGGAKEPDPAGWLPIQLSQVTPKTDITNVYALGRIDSSVSPPHPVIVNGMERLPKAGDVHLDFEFNRQVTGAGLATLPDRQVGDLLIAYDLGGSRNSNSNAISVRVFVAKANTGCSPAPCAGYDYANPDATASGSGEVTQNGVTASMNTVDVAAGPWLSYDDHYSLTSTLPAFSFAEAAIDVAQATQSKTVCLNFVTVKSRASESVTSQLKDTTGTQPFPFCGALNVHKYIDTDADGSRAGEVYPGAGWSFTVTGPAPSTTSVCSGTTDVNGDLVCATGSLTDLLPGTYTVTETQNAGWVNTDPGPLPLNAAATVSKTVAVLAGSSQTVYFGNTCYVAKTFEVTDVPAGQSGLFAWYVVRKGPGSGAAKVKVPLTLSGTTASATVSDTFIASNEIDWGFGINLGAANEQERTVKTGESLAAGKYPACALTNTAPFPRTTLNGTKYKDANASGTNDAGDKALGGFEFELVQGGAVAKTATSDATGAYAFTGVAAGSYTVREVQQPGWLQTEPASGGRAVTVGLNDVSITIGAFGNTPLSDISVIFTPQTNATTATITCDDGSGSQSGNTYSAKDLKVGTYTCTVAIVDP